jgi:hypothetical protein
MQFTSPVRSVQPQVASGAWGFTTEDLHKAFAAQTDPDEDLFYALFGEEWDALKPSQKFLICSKIAALVEGEAATGFAVGQGRVEPKP